MITALRELGVRPGGVLLVHTSFRAIGPVDGGPAGLIAALRGALGDDGTLVMPSMSSEDPYDPATTPTDGMGIVAETFWRMPGVLRGTHPGCSFAAVGPHAEAITAPHPVSPPHGAASSVGRVHDLDGQVLLLGVGHDANTTMHLAEDVAGVPYRSVSEALVRDGDELRTVLVEEPDHCCRGFALADEWLGDAQRTGPIGNGTARLMAARDLLDVVVPRLRENPLVFLCPRERSCGDCDDAWESLDRAG